MHNPVSGVGTARPPSDHDTAAQAEQQFRRILSTNPKDTAALCGLANILIEAPRPQEAFNLLSSALRIQPTNAELLVMMGRFLHGAGQIQGAVQALEQALRVSPASLAPRIWLARCRTALGRAAEAISILQPLAAANPNNALIQTALGQAYWLMGAADKALAHFQSSLALEPTAQTHTDVGWALQASGRADEALEHFSTALSLNPRLGLAAAGKAAILADRGQSDDARQTIEAILNLGVLDVMLLTTYARLAKTPEQRTTVIAAIDRGLTMTKAPKARSALLFARGTLLDAQNNYDAAFASFREANDLIPSTYNLPVIQRTTDDLIRVFSREKTPRLARSTNTDPAPIFIVGMPRSGTTLVEQILASHPAVHGAGELNDMLRLVVSIPAILGLPPQSHFPDNALTLTAAQLDTLADHYLKRIHAVGGPAQRVTDKLPHNFASLGLIDLLFPAAHVIHCVRNPLDTCLSCYFTPLSLAHAYRSRLRDLAAAYREYRRLMDHWRTVLRVPMLDVQYESLASDPEPIARQIIDFVGLPWDDRCLRFYETHRQITTASVDQVRRPAYTSSINRWKHYEKHLAPLIDGLRGFI